MSEVRCGVCRRTINQESREVEGLGKVGPECIGRLKGLERAFGLLSERHRQPMALSIKKALRGLGFNAHVRPDVVSGFYKVYLKGGRAAVRAGVNRSAYGQWLLAQAAEFELGVAA